MAATNRDGIIIQISRTGVADTLTAIDAANGETWTNTGVEWIEVNNGGGTSTTASIPYANTVDGQTVPPKTNAVAAGAREKWGPWPVPMFGTAPVVTWSGNTTSVTFSIVRPGS